MARRSRVRDGVVCEHCGIIGRVRTKQNICSRCHLKLPRGLCRRCHYQRPMFDVDKQLCRTCHKMLARPLALCSACGLTSPLYDQGNRLCRQCDFNNRKRLRNAEIRKCEILCLSCGTRRPRILKEADICYQCYMEARRTNSPCARCGKVKKIYYVRRNLCRWCGRTLDAGKLLPRYVESFSSPFPNNTRYFQMLASSITWSSVSDGTFVKFNDFGNYLQCHELPDQITWELIDQLLPPLPEKEQRHRIKNIRSSLLQLGHCLAKKGLLETWDQYIYRRNALQPLSRVKGRDQILLREFADAMIAKHWRWKTAKNALEILVAFSQWAKSWRLEFPSAIQLIHIHEFIFLRCFE